jgi:restriction endonuclease S subunit
MIRELPIYAPAIEEQHKILEILEERLSRLDASVSLANAMEEQSLGLKRSLLQAAFTGQLTKEVVSV